MYSNFYIDVQCTWWMSSVKCRCIQIHITQTQHATGMVWYKLTNSYRGSVFLTRPLMHTVFTDKTDQFVSSDWTSMGIHQYTTITHCGLQIYTAVNGYTLRFTDIHCGLQIYTAVYIYTLRFTDIHCGLQIYTNIYLKKVQTTSHTSIYKTNVRIK